MKKLPALLVLDAALGLGATIPMPTAAAQENTAGGAAKQPQTITCVDVAPGAKRGPVGNV